MVFHCIIDNRLIIASSFRNIWLDFVVTINGELKIGKGHYKLAQKATAVIMAGELLINDEGLIAAINNNSGHYQPSSYSFLKFIECLAEHYSILYSQFTMEIIQWEQNNAMENVFVKRCLAYTMFLMTSNSLLQFFKLLLI